MQDESPSGERGLSWQPETVNFQHMHDHSAAREHEQEMNEPGDLAGRRKEQDTATPAPLAGRDMEDRRHEPQPDEEAVRRAHTAEGEEEDDDDPTMATDVEPRFERVYSHRESWTTLESAESRIAPLAPRIVTTRSDFATDLYAFSYLVFFSIFGALARIGLGALTFYPGAPVVTGVLWANVGGSLLMGFFGEERKLFREEWGQRQHKRTEENSGGGGGGSGRAAGAPSSEEEKDESQVLSPGPSLTRHKVIKKTIPLYIGLTTGFCGSFTSFSTLMGDTFLALSNDLHNPNTDHILPRHAGYSFMAVVAIIMYTISLSHAALIAGAHLAVGIEKFTPTLPFTFTRKFLDPAFVVLGLGCWLGSIFLALWPPDRDLGIREFWRGRAVFAVVFAPLGTLLRYYVSLLLNPRIRKFPLGTFTANIVGTMILGMCFDLQHARNVVGLNRRTGCQVLTGVIEGFCGCLTTVSTLIAELSDLDVRHAYPYWFATFATGLGVLVVIMGSMRWTVGFDQSVC